MHFARFFRLHGHRMCNSNPQAGVDYKIGADNEVWSFGEKAYSIMKELMLMRERLKPYIMEQMKTAHEKGTPVMRPLFFEFTNDEECNEVEDQFMFGPDILVAPVVHQGQTSRRLYLPREAKWRDAWTGEIFKGGQSITVDAPLEKIPVFIKITGKSSNSFLMTELFIKECP